MEMCEQAMKWFPEAWCCQCLMLCPGQCWNDKSLRPLPTYLRHCGPPQPPSDTIPGLKGTILQFYPNTKFTTKPATSDCVGVLHSPLRPRICQFIYVVLVGSWNVLCLCCIFSSCQLYVSCRIALPKAGWHWLSYLSSPLASATDRKDVPMHQAGTSASLDGFWRGETPRMCSCAWLISCYFPWWLVAAV